ncbi:Vacuolar protein sorting-associated protein 72 [Spathaspora sp. JA1]|nr:Vacuolar protein sorting-associated protein 72 [Spathaspora sp. JA1]
MDEDSLVATRARRANAGSRLKQLIEQEQQGLQDTSQFISEDDDNVNLLFQEDEQDEEFIEEEVEDEEEEQEEGDEEEGEGEGEEQDDGEFEDSRKRRHPEETVEDDVFSDSDLSMSDSDQSEGEKELQRQERIKKRQLKKKKGTVPPIIKKIQPTSPLHKKPKRTSLITSDSLLMSQRRSSSRSAAVESKQALIEKLKQSEQRRAKVLATTTTRVKKKHHELTQQERLDQAVITEKENIESLMRFREQEIVKKERQRHLLLSKRIKLHNIIRLLSQETLIYPNEEVKQAKKEYEKNLKGRRRLTKKQLKEIEEGGGLDLLPPFEIDQDLPLVKQERERREQEKKEQEEREQEKKDQEEKIRQEQEGTQGKQEVTVEGDKEARIQEEQKETSQPDTTEDGSESHVETDIAINEQNKTADMEIDQPSEGTLIDNQSNGKDSVEVHGDRDDIQSTKAEQEEVILLGSETTDNSMDSDESTEIKVENEASPDTIEEIEQDLTTVTVVEEQENIAEANKTTTSNGSEEQDIETIADSTSDEPKHEEDVSTTVNDETIPDSSSDEPKQEESNDKTTESILPSEEVDVQEGETIEESKAETEEITIKQEKRVKFADEEIETKEEESLETKEEESVEPEQQEPEQQESKQQESKQQETTSGETFEGPPQRVCRNTLYFIDFNEDRRETRLNSSNLKTMLFGKQCLLPASRRFKDGKTILHIGKIEPYNNPKQELQDDLFQPISDLTEDNPIFDDLKKLPKLGIKQDIIETIEENIEQESTEINITTEAPTGLYLPNGNKKPCMISGTEVKYFDPSTGIPYSSVETYKLLKLIEQGQIPWLSLTPENNDNGIVEIYLGSRDGTTRHASGVPEGFDV